MYTIYFEFRVKCNFAPFTVKFTSFFLSLCILSTFFSSVASSFYYLFACNNLSRHLKFLCVYRVTYHLFLSRMRSNLFKTYTNTKLRKVYRWCVYSTRCDCLHTFARVHIVLYLDGCEWNWYFRVYHAKVTLLGKYIYCEYAT